MSTISIIGAGGMAAAMADRTAKAGHAVGIPTLDAFKAQALAVKLGSGAIVET